MAWQHGRRVTGLWAANQNNNAWAHVDGLGWRKCDHRGNTTNILILAAHAKGENIPIDFNEEVVDGNTAIVELYVW